MVFGHLGLIPLALETSAPAGSSVEDLRGFKVSFECVNYYHGCRWIDHPPSTEHPSTRILQGLQLEGRPKKRRASRFMMLPHKWLARWAMFVFGEGSWYGVRARSGGMRWNVHYRVDINIDNYVCVSRAVIFGLYIYIYRLYIQMAHLLSMIVELFRWTRIVFVDSILLQQLVIWRVIMELGTS